jgi:formylglycine-generating enzyme required for sulfatase activity
MLLKKILISAVILLAACNPPPEQQESQETANIFFRDRLTDGSQGPEMVWIPGGSFRMGDIQGGGDSDEKPVHSVSVARFAMSRYEVTVGEFRLFVKATGYKAEKQGSCFSWSGNSSGNNWYKIDFYQTDAHPVVCVSWDDASAYAEWLSQQTGHTYRLPTEAQWEYAARAGTTTKYWWGNHIGSNKANCDNSYCGDKFEHTAPVGSFSPNPFGLYDTVGNVWEWTCSKYEDKYNGEENKCTAQKSGLWVLRGGAWGFDPWHVRAALRGMNSHENRTGYLGFRLARL